MKKRIEDLAICGGKPLFGKPLPVGQMNMPAWERFQPMMQGIFDRRYYTNHWVLAQEYERRLEGMLHVRNAVTVTNATIGLSLAALALGLKGRVIVPAFTFAATAQALVWAGLEPVFCDIDSRTHAISRATAEPLLDAHSDISGILGVHIWGNACDVDGLESLARERGIKVFYDAAHAVGCTRQGEFIGNFGECEVFSTHATKVLNTTEGGFITTNNDALAETLRNMRASYGRRRSVEIPINANGRFSEFQAGFGLLSLDDFAANCARNRATLGQYQDCLKDVPGLRLMRPTHGEEHNCQYVVLEVDADGFGMGRDQLVEIMQRENILARKYFTPGLHRAVPFNEATQPELPITEALCGKVMQLPSGSMIGKKEVNAISALVRFIHQNSDRLARIA